MSAAVSSSSKSATTPLRLAMLGMIEGNGHPYSWSAIINGYDRQRMAACPYPVIAKYLGAQPFESVCVPGARVTHLWTDRSEDASLVAGAALIPNVVVKPEEVIGYVDAVIIATDDGLDHVRRARPFIEAGLPVFIDKPLAVSIPELRTFLSWHKAGARFLSSSGLRYAPELDSLLAAGPGLGVGELRWCAATCCKTWERYGIHLLEPVSRLVGPGWLSVRLESQPGLEVAHLQHRSGVQFTLPVMYDAGPSHGSLHLCGTTGSHSLRFSDTYTSFRRQMVAFIDFVRTGTSTYAFAETIELMAVLIAGVRSRTENSRRVTLAEIQHDLNS